jgi:hypothetical protein
LRYNKFFRLDGSMRALITILAVFVLPACSICYAQEKTTPEYIEITTYDCHCTVTDPTIETPVLYYAEANFFSNLTMKFYFGGTSRELSFFYLPIGPFNIIFYRGLLNTHASGSSFLGAIHLKGTMVSFLSESSISSFECNGQIKE